MIGAAVTVAPYRFMPDFSLWPVFLMARYDWHP